MADGRAAIFEALRAARPPAVARPPRTARAALSGDPVSVFAERLGAAGGRLLDTRREGLVAGLAEVPDLQSAEHVWSSVAALYARGVGATARAPHDLAPLDVACIQGVLGVAECGAVWQVPVNGIERAATLLAEQILVVLAADAIVPRLFDAYARLVAPETRFGWFLCGPSKTADIEQALVLGAHGPRRATVLLV